MTPEMHKSLNVALFYFFGYVIPWVVGIVVIFKYAIEVLD